MKTFLKRVVLVAITCSLLTPQSSWATEESTDILVDAFLCRPTGLVLTAAGSVCYTVILPFSLIVGGTKKVGHALVKKPFCYTFNRPFGSDWQTMDQ